MVPGLYSMGRPIQPDVEGIETRQQGGCAPARVAVRSLASRAQKPSG
jgi:hypothetical protein